MISVLINVFAYLLTESSQKYFIMWCEMQKDEQGYDKLHINGIIGCAILKPCLQIQSSV